MTGFSCKIIYGAGDSIAQNFSSYDETYEYSEMYDYVCSVLVCSGLVYGAFYRLAWIG